MDVDGNVPKRPSGGSFYQVSVPSADVIESDAGHPIISAPGDHHADKHETDLPMTPPTPVDVTDSAVVGSPQQKSGKPQVVVRIRPSPNIGSNIFEVDSETKTMQIRVERETKRQDPKHKSVPSFIYFPADGVLENSSQEDTFNTVSLEIVEKAMQGVPGMVVAVGPEVSGKTFSLFGLSGRYTNRGITARALEKMFEIKQMKEGETDYKFGMGIIEVRRERIRDLLTLGPYEINDVGDRGPKGMYIEEVDCLEHGLGLLLRALTGQKLIHKEPYERYHTIVYMEIIGLSPLASEQVQFHSRITFAEIASAPYAKSEETAVSLAAPSQYHQCTPQPIPKMDTRFKTKQSVFPSRKCCNPGHTTGPLAESIAVRRDIFALEQIFLKANEMERFRKYFAKLEQLGLSMIASEKRKFTTGHNVRQNKLAHCLKDILDGVTEIRILLHVRPDKAYLRSSLEAMRFAERARLVPSNIESESSKGKAARTEDQILQEVITDIAPELTRPSNVENLTSEKMRVIQEQAVRYFENNIDSMKVCSKEKVKSMFENFRLLWNFLWELELNVSLRKAQEDMKEAYHHAGHHSTTGRTTSTQGPSVGKDGLGATDGDEDAQQTHSKDVVQKKSARKQKRDKKKGKKDKHRKDSAEQKLDSPPVEKETPKEGEGGDPAAAATTPGTGEEGATTTQPETGPEERRISSVPGANNEQVPGPTAEVTPVTPEVTPPPPPAEGTTAVVPPTSTGATEGGGEPGQEGTLDPNRPSLHPQAEGGDLTTIQHLRHSILPRIVDEKKTTISISEEERAAAAAKLVEQISNNFEEMKKIARRHAIHLLRAGVKRPPWMSLF